MLAVLGSDLKPGERLPSTCELARRFQIHPNTVSASYRQLVRDGWAANRFWTDVLWRSSRRSANSACRIDQATRRGFDRGSPTGSIPADRPRLGCTRHSAYRDSQSDHIAWCPPDSSLIEPFWAVGRQSGSLRRIHCRTESWIQETPERWS
jgi:DNA-binding transcriptional MocR family regulator